MDDGPTLMLADAGALVGGYRWIEHRLFQITGSWAATCREPAVKLHLLEASYQHAWHAGLWADRLPSLDHVDPEALSVPFGPASRPLLDAVEGGTRSAPPGPGPGVAPGPVPGTAADADPLDAVRLAALYRVTVPRLVATYGRHLAMATAVADGPTIRALRLVRRDEVESWLAGEALLEALLASPEAAAAAAETQRELEAIVVGAGIGVGIVPWPDVAGGAAPRGSGSGDRTEAGPVR